MAVRGRHNEGACRPAGASERAMDTLPPGRQTGAHGVAGQPESYYPFMYVVLNNLGNVSQKFLKLNEHLT